MTTNQVPAEQKRPPVYGDLEMGSAVLAKGQSLLNQFSRNGMTKTAAPTVAAISVVELSLPIPVVGSAAVFATVGEPLTTGVPK